MENGVDQTDTLVSPFINVFIVETDESWNLSSNKLLHDYDLF